MTDPTDPTDLADLADPTALRAAGRRAAWAGCLLLLCLALLAGGDRAAEPAEAPRTYTLLRLADLVPAKWQSHEKLAPGATAKVAMVGEELRFTLTGPAGTRQRWRFPLENWPYGDLKVALQLSVAGLAMPAKPPTIRLAQFRHAPGGKVDYRTVSLFQAEIAEGAERLTVEAAGQAEGWTCETLVVELVSAGPRAELTLTGLTLTMSFQSNFLPEAELTALLAEPLSPPPLKIRQAGDGTRYLVNAQGEPAAPWDMLPSHLELKQFEQNLATTRRAVNPSVAIMPIGWPLQLPGVWDERVLGRKLEPPSAGGLPALLYLNLAAKLDRIDYQFIEDWMKSDFPYVTNIYLTQTPGKLEFPYGDRHDPAWRIGLARILRQMVGQLIKAKVAPRMQGIYLTSYLQYNDLDIPGRRFVELEQPAWQAAFRTWLGQRYASDAELAKAWDRPGTTVANAIPLPMNAWPPATAGDLLHPGLQRAALDSRAFLAETQAEILLFAAQQIKALTKGQWLVAVGGEGVAPGQAGCVNIWQGAPWVWHRVVQSPAVDMIVLEQEFCTLSNPDQSQPSFSAVSDMAFDLALTPWLRRQGKLVALNYEYPKQEDGWPLVLATMLTQGVQPIIERSGWQASWEKLAPLRQRVAALRANAQSTPPLIIAFDPAALAGLGRQPNRTLPPRGSYELTTEDRATRRQHLLTLPSHQWTRLGQAWELWPIIEPWPASTRMLWFWHCLDAVPGMAERLKPLQTDGRVLLSTWADFTRGRDSLGTGERDALLGLRTRIHEQAERFFLRPEPPLAGLLAGRAIAEPFGAPMDRATADRQRSAQMTFAPQFSVVAEDGVEILASNHDTKLPAVARRRGEGYQVVYSASPLVNAELVQALLTEAGAPPVLESQDWSWLSGPFIFIQASGDGERTLRFPTPTALCEIFTDADLPPATTHSLRVRDGQVYAFYRGSLADWQALAPAAP